MATIKKVSKAKNLSAGPSKKTPIAPKVDPNGAYTKVQERTLKHMKKGGKIKKAQGGVKATADSSAYFKNQENIFNKLAKSEKGNSKVAEFNRQYFKDQAGKAVSDQVRQYHKGKPGYDANGNPIKKNKAGGKTSKNWIQKAVKTMRTDKPCTGPKFGSKTCPPGSKRYNLAKTFKKMAKKK